ncbi:MAG TPA: hypothetical protein VML96_07180, partial [Egibacteraceae bacterium]|nr:hypothetical protein [Egibacteraceae bacterium]
PDQGAPVSPTERAAALAGRLLDRHGVVTRSAVAAEAVPGGFSAVYGVLKAMEEAGRARRGYFVEGLGGAQFALPGAVDRLRSMREGADGGQSERVALAATDPANPFGAALAWPDPAGDHAHSPRRMAGAYVVLVDGALAGYAERGGRSLLTFGADDGLLDGFAAGLGRLVSARQVRSLQVQRIDGGPPADQPLVAHLRRHGFADHPRGLIRR